VRRDHRQAVRAARLPEPAGGARHLPPGRGRHVPQHHPDQSAAAERDRGRGPLLGLRLQQVMIYALRDGDFVFLQYFILKLFLVVIKLPE